MRKFFIYVLLGLISINSVPKPIEVVEVSNRSEAKHYLINELKQLVLKLDTFLTVKYLETSEFSVDNLIAYVELLDKKNSDIVIKQAIIETGWFKSNIAQNFNNYFGMHLPRVRETTASGYIIADNNARVAVYNHWTESVKDYYLWRDYWDSKGRMCDNYYKFLHNVGYSETGSYVNTLKKLDLSKQLKRINRELNC